MSGSPRASAIVEFSVVVPVRNEQDNILPLLAEIHSALGEHPDEAGLDPFIEQLGGAERLALLLDRVDELPLRRHEIRGNPAGLLARMVHRIDALQDAGGTAARFRALAEQVQQGKLSPDAIDEEAISNALYTSGMPDPDLLIRTAGEMRVSNFLLWQISYAELWVTEQCWPDFDCDSLHQALRDYAGRERRFGGLKG